MVNPVGALRGENAKTCVKTVKMDGGMAKPVGAIKWENCKAVKPVDPQMVKSGRWVKRRMGAEPSASGAPAHHVF